MSIVSVNLIVLHEGGLLGKRNNEPVKGEWFIPGGRLRKGERSRDGVHCIAKEELGTDLEIKENLDEQFYDASEVPDASKHYVAIVSIGTPISGTFVPESQHRELKVFKNFLENLHPYVEPAHC